LEVTLHQEADGTGHVIIDAGDWQHEIFAEEGALASLLGLAKEWIANVPVE
jgi:hypothetical protein